MKDFLGRDLQVGDRCVWGVGGRRTHGLRVGLVVALEPGELGGQRWVRVAARLGLKGTQMQARHVVTLGPPPEA